MREYFLKSISPCPDHITVRLYRGHLGTFTFSYVFWQMEATQLWVTLLVYLKGEGEEVRGRGATFTERLPGIELEGLEITT